MLIQVRKLKIVWRSEGTCLRLGSPKSRVWNRGLPPNSLFWKVTPRNSHGRLRKMREGRRECQSKLCNWHDHWVGNRTSTNLGPSEELKRRPNIVLKGQKKELLNKWLSHKWLTPLHLQVGHALECWTGSYRCPMGAVTEQEAKDKSAAGWEDM